MYPGMKEIFLFNRAFKRIPFDFRIKQANINLLSVSPIHAYIWDAQLMS